MYVKDISKKIRASLKFKIERGEYIGSAPYGYKKIPQIKNKLFIDEERAPIIKEIFRLYREGFGYLYIAKYLNQKNIMPPSGNSLKNICNKWNAISINRIINNKVYIGHTVQGLSEKINFKTKKIKKLPKNQWNITLNTHEAIIDSHEFDEIQLIKNNKKNYSTVHKGVLHACKGILFCGNCGSSMFARKRKNRPMGYICSNYSKNGKLGCTSHYIREKVLLDVLISEINEFLGNNIKEELIGMINDYINNENFQNTRERIYTLERELTKKISHQEILYMDKLENKINEELFIRMNINIVNRIHEIKKSIDVLKAISIKHIDSNKIFLEVIEWINNYNLSNDMIKMMIHKIIIFEKNDNLNKYLYKYSMETNNLNGIIYIEFEF